MAWLWIASWLLGTSAWALDHSGAEQAWMAANPTVEVLLVDGALPYVERRSDDTPTGFAIDMLNLVSQRTGLRWRYTWLPTPQAVLQRFVEGRAMLTPMAAPSPDRLALASFPGPWLSTEIVLVTRSDVTDTSMSQNFAGRKIAVVRGYVPGNLLREQYPGANIVDYGSNLEALRAVATGQADASVFWLEEAVYHIEANLLANLRVHRVPEAARSFLGPAIAIRQVELAGIVSKAMASIGAAERAELARRWLPRGQSVQWAAGQAQLSPAERAWVEANGSVRIGYDRSFAPFTSAAALNGFEGLGADMFRLAAQKIGLQVVVQQGATFADALAAAARGDIDVVVGMARTETRRRDFDFVGPMSSSPTVLVMRSSDSRQWRTPDDIDGGALGLLKDHFLLPQLRSRRPGLALVTFESQQDVLAAVNDGRVEAAIGNATVINRVIDRQYTGRLRISGVLPDADSELYFGVPRTRPELTRVLAKGFAAITPGEIAEINKRWLFVNVQPGLRWDEVLRWAIPLGLAAAVVLIVLVQSNRRLKRAHATEAQARDAAEQARQKHERAEALLHDIAEQAPGVVFRYVLQPDGRFAHRYTSPGFARLLGQVQPDPERSILRQLAAGVREDHREAALAAELHSMVSGAPFKVTVPYFNPERGLLWLHAEAVRRSSPDGVTTWTGYVVDVTPERELQERVKREAESRNLLLASASHELRAPTHTLYLALQSVAGQGLSRSDGLALDVARQAARTLAQLLDDVLEAASLSGQPLKLRPRCFELRLLLDEVANAWRAAAGSKGLAFETHVDEGLPSQVCLDPLRLKQILTNLLSNACKYTASGRVWLQASAQKDGRLCFVVGDTGQGIDARAKARLYEPFAAGDVAAPEGSTGLGLAICWQLATLMSGKLTMVSEPGQGTVVKLWLPSPPGGSSAQATPVARKGEVLVCDDDPVSRLLMTEMLSRGGYDARDVPDAEKALDCWRRGGVAVIITDLDMPGIGGRELIRRVREAEAGSAATTAIIVCSGRVRPGPSPDEAGGYDAHVRLAKPVHMEVLFAALQGLGVQLGNETSSRMGPARLAEAFEIGQPGSAEPLEDR